MQTHPSINRKIPLPASPAAGAPHRAGMQPPQRDWPALCREWEKSGVPQKTFCRDKDISYVQFVYQRQRWKNKPAVPAKLLPVERVPLPSMEGQPRPSHFIVEWPSGIKLSIPMHADASTLITLLTTLGG